MPENAQPGHQYLSGDHAKSTQTDIEWDQDNQQWWDWYMSLAENAPGEGEENLIELPKPATYPAPNEQALVEELSQPFSLSPSQVESFQSHGFIKLKNVLSPGALSLLRAEMATMFEEQSEQLGSRFGSLEMMWEQNQAVRAFVFSTRLAKLAAELMGVGAVRLYHDNGLSKQPGCGRTPWHYDGHHFPIATEKVCTVWIPLQEIPDAMGPLGFAKSMDVVKLVEDIPFNKFDSSYDQRVNERLRDHGIEVDLSPFDLGEVSFHHNLNFHTASSNRTTIPRMVLATTYFEDGARVIDAPHMVNGDWRRFMPGIEPGQVINTPLNPILYPNHLAKPLRPAASEGSNSDAK
ncbi:MAG: phytanoyl-CoA dioxygenase family protein [Pirellulaceae bacterium]